MYTKDIANAIKAVPASAVATATAAGAGDGTEVNGLDIDTINYQNRYDSICFLIAVESALQDTETTVVTANLQDADDDGAGSPVSWADVTDPAALLTLTGETGGTTERGIAKLGIDLTKVKRHIRVQFTPELSASGTDTATLYAVAVLAGAAELPVA